MKGGVNMRGQKDLQVVLRLRKVLRGRKERMFSRISGGNLLQILGSIGGDLVEFIMNTAVLLLLRLLVMVFFIALHKMFLVWCGVSSQSQKQHAGIDLIFIAAKFLNVR